ncbi:hypothetical protein [Nitrospina gracilis]|uniref:hypothetical protein n=1 Tax=Nitrospina gracilis TaxID=35801 RepID=UPI001F1F25E9|nr:hypothetical protein [Nitrospina gracilis]MCF8719502.1 hypothetical protein [Nitrospina gracilis Nb-211]
MKKWILMGALLLAMTAACDNTQTTVEEQPLQLPEKEKTWVKTEEVEITKDKVAANPEPTLKAEVDPALKDTLTNVDVSVQVAQINSADSCHAVLEPMDKARKAVQREGGMWHAFERNEKLRPFSDTGFQIDSNMNKLFFALSYLCKTAKGVPMTGLAITVDRMIESRGVEGTRKHMIQLGNPESVTDQWIKYAQEAKRIADRNIPYEEVGRLVLQTKPLIDLYQELLARKVDESNEQKFLSDSVTLLDVIHSRMSGESHLAMARTEDLQVPYEKFRNEM